MFWTGYIPAHLMIEQSIKTKAIFTTISGLLTTIVLTCLTPAYSAAWDDDIVTIVKNARLGVVTIEARSPIASRLGPLGDVLSKQNGFSDQHRWYTSIATGVVWDSLGHVVTTASVVKNAVDFKIRNASGSEFPAKLVGKDDETNLAVLKCEGCAKSVSHSIPIPIRVNSLPEGSWVSLLGYGFGGVPTISTGVAGIPPGRHSVSKTWFQFTAPIRPGNSGSALIDSDGHLAGIVLGREEDIGFHAVIKLLTQQKNQDPSNASPVATFSNFGVAIPANIAQKIIKELIDSGSVTRGWIGISVKEGECVVENQKYSGLEIVRIVNNSPASRSGLLIGDFLLSVGDINLTSIHDLGDKVAETNPGVLIPIKYARNNHLYESEIMVKKRPSLKSIENQSQETAVTLPEFGLCIQDLSVELREYLNTDAINGVIISEMTADSHFSNAGCQVGDIILRVNDRPVLTTGEFVNYLKEVKAGTMGLTIEILRDGSILTFHTQF